MKLKMTVPGNLGAIQIIRDTLEGGMQNVTKYHIGGGGGSDFSAATSPLILKSNYCKLTCWCSMKAHGIREAGLEEVVIFCG
jgi:hypothetical protein